MKKDIFGGNIKREYFSYVLFTIVFGPLISIGVGALCTYGLFQIESGAFDIKWYFSIGLTAFFYLFGILYFLLSIFAIRKYPKYPKLRSMLLNSDSYFVGNNSKEYRGHWRGRAAFDAVTHIAEQNKGLENIKYPKKYKRYIILTIIGIVLMFAFIFITWKVTENIELLPKAFQNKYVIFGSFAVAEITDIVLSFILATLIGAILLKLPISVNDGCSVSWIDSFFVSVSISIFSFTKPIGE